MVIFQLEKSKSKLKKRVNVRFFNKEFVSMFNVIGLDGQVQKWKMESQNYKKVVFKADGT